MNRLYHESEDWVAQGTCRAYDPELFFPVNITGADGPEVHLAKAICDTCPVRRECLNWAVSRGEAHGIWGGTTPEERRYLRVELATAS
ncbi:WhiB family transcriptional regulator [Lipingzhangella sp. LS1_29]|uniref:Transcriptional regulator WhiB n=1 Tax=Lipingzhangella rawalii TaxID=2055835 RepID=A0ABU2H5K4_9ACTN|nr:WhiB family transcriptional regulator [Lipingzhangella rawalii]MDS1269899.1 WhiB family transcriptional regulator [Lipingzhangella rawalii]